MENSDNNLIELVIKLGVFDDLSNNTINSILNILKEYFDAENCVWERTNRVDDNYSVNDIKSSDSLYLYLNNDFVHDVIVIYNPNKNIENYIESTIVIRTILNKLVLIDKLIESANTDALTKVLNNNALEERFVKDMFINTGVSFIDVNGLGIINNKYGHEAGDEMLKIIAQVIQSAFRKKDIFRKGGDEFIIICENIDENLFHSKLEIVRKRINESGYSASFGSVYAKKINDIRVLIKLADERMYVEKEAFRRTNPSKYVITK